MNETFSEIGFTTFNESKNFREEILKGKELSNYTFSDDEDAIFDFDFSIFQPQIFLHLWLGSLFLFILVPPSMFLVVPNWQTKKSTLAKCCSLIIRSFQEAPELKYTYFVLVSMFFTSFVAFLWGLSIMFPTTQQLSFGPNVTFWSVLSMVAATGRFIFTLYRSKPKFFDQDIEAVYADVFQPMRLSRNDFGKMLKSTRCLSLVLPGQKYVEESLSRVDTLSLVLNGRLLVSQNGKPLHTVSRHQFVDSPEWFGVAADEHFQISATALEETKILVWHRDKLKLILTMSDPFMKIVLDHVVARDVVRKLTQTHEGKGSKPSLALAVPSAGLSEWDGRQRAKITNGNLFDPESNIHFVNHHHQVSDEEDCFSWTLSRISEHDDEEETASAIYEPRSTQV